jgi:hypothetical protein
MSTSPRYMPVTEVAKHVRQALRAAFPAVKFSVRSDSYSMGASIRISWTDGPSKASVDAIVDAFQGADFNGMEDIKEYRGTMIVAGEAVRSGADFIFCERQISDTFWSRIAAEIAPVLCVEAPSRADAGRMHPVIGGRLDFSQYVRRAAENRTNWLN